MSWITDVEEKANQFFELSGIDREKFNKLIQIGGFLLVIYICLKIWRRK